MVNSNAKQIIKQVLSSGGTQGLLSVVDVTGIRRYIADFSAYPADVEDSFTLVAADAGISVGSGTAAASENDYQLVSPITSGLTGTVTTSKAVDVNGNTSITFTISLTNTSASDITISEIGYKQEISASDSLNGTTATDRVFMLDRSLIDPLTLSAGGQAVIEYKLKAVVTNGGGAVDSKTITANGTYDAEDDDLDGYSTVVVSVSPNVGTKTITTNGTYSASTDSYDGYSEVTVNVPSASLDTKTITQNGTYDAEDDDLDGYSSVVVNVSGGGGSGGSLIKIYDQTMPSTSNLDDTFTFTCPSAGKIVVADFAYADGATLTIDGVTYTSYEWARYYYSINGVYDVNANSTVVLHTYGSGSSGIDAKVYFVANNEAIGTKTITRNGVYRASDDFLDGYSQVVVNVSGAPTQINPFPVGASTITLYASNGISVNSSSISADGTANMEFNEFSAGYEGFTIELNVTAGNLYLIEFEYQNVDCQYFGTSYVLGYSLSDSAQTDYSRYTDWDNNIERNSTLQHFKVPIIATGNKLYLNVNVCVYSDSRTNNAAITNLKVYEIDIT